MCSQTKILNFSIHAHSHFKHPSIISHDHLRTPHLLHRRRSARQPPASHLDAHHISAHLRRSAPCATRQPIAPAPSPRRKKPPGPAPHPVARPVPGIPDDRHRPTHTAATLFKKCRGYKPHTMAISNYTTKISPDGDTLFQLVESEKIQLLQI